jgi:hypothetical protein
MNQFNFFIDPQSFFLIIEQIRNNYSMEIVFRRFNSETIKAGFKTINREENLYETYKIGKYSQTYISLLGNLPIHEQDWQFLDRNADDLIVIEGGRIYNNSLEMFRLRLLSKISNVKHIFKQIKKSIIGISFNQGLYTKSGEFYNNIFYNDGVLDYELRYDINKDSQSFIYVKKVNET